MSEPVAYLFGCTDFEQEALLPHEVDPEGFSENPGYYTPLFPASEIERLKTKISLLEQGQDDLLAELLGTRTQRDELLAACEEFVRKCECGEARSVRSYAQMKAAITKVKTL